MAEPNPRPGGRPSTPGSAPAADARSRARAGVLVCSWAGFAGAAAGASVLGSTLARGLVVLAALAVTGILALRAGRGTAAGVRGPETADRFRRLVAIAAIVLAVVVVALVLGGRGELETAAVVIVVGAAFLPLASILDFPLYAITGLGLVMIGGVGLLLGLLDATGAQTVAGVGAGVILWTTAGAMTRTPGRFQPGPTRTPRPPGRRDGRSGGRDADDAPGPRARRAPGEARPPR